MFNRRATAAGAAAIALGILLAVFRHRTPYQPPAQDPTHTQGTPPNPNPLHP